MSHSGAAWERVPRGIDDFDRDSLHTLPLSMIPLQTFGLRRARMIKNARYESVVELFKDAATGSGQFYVDQLVTEFADIDEDDLGILRMLRELPSYDMYSLRIRLRELDIPVNDCPMNCAVLPSTRFRAISKRLCMKSISHVPWMDAGLRCFDEADAHEFSARHRVVQLNPMDCPGPGLAQHAERRKVSACELGRVPTLSCRTMRDIYLSMVFVLPAVTSIGYSRAVNRLFDSLEEIVTHPQLRQDREFVRFCDAWPDATVRARQGVSIDGAFCERLRSKHARHVGRHQRLERFNTSRAADIGKPRHAGRYALRALRVPRRMVEEVSHQCHRRAIPPGRVHSQR